MRDPTPSRFEQWAALTAALALAAGCTQWSWKVGGAYVSPADPLVWAAAAVALAAAIRGRVRPAAWLPPPAAWLLVAAALASGLRATSRTDAAKEAFQWAEYFLAGYAAFAFSLRDPAVRRRLVFLFLGIAAVVTAWALAQYADRARPFFHVQASFGNRNVLGGFLALAVPMAVSLCATPRAVPRAARWLLGALAIAGVGVAGAGGTLIGLACGLALLAAWRGGAGVLAFVALAVLAAGVALPHLPRQNLKSAVESVALFDSDGNATPRCTEWQAAVNMWAERPLVGAGAGNYQGSIGAYYGYIPRENRNVTEADSHNLYLVLAATTGVIGVAAFAGLLFGAAGDAARWWARGRDPLDRAVAVGAIAAVLAFSVNAVWAGLLVRGLGVPLAFMLALGRAGAAGREPDGLRAD